IWPNRPLLLTDREVLLPMHRVARLRSARQAAKQEIVLDATLGVARPPEPDKVVENQKRAPFPRARLPPEDERHGGGAVDLRAKHERFNGRDSAHTAFKRAQLLDQDRGGSGPAIRALLEHPADMVFHRTRQV